jgi:hypothetical protein
MRSIAQAARRARGALPRPLLEGSSVTHLVGGSIERDRVRAVLSLVMNPGLADEQAFELSPGSVTIGRTSDNYVV